MIQNQKILSEIVSVPSSATLGFIISVTEDVYVKVDSLESEIIEVVSFNLGIDPRDIRVRTEAELDELIGKISNKEMRSVYRIPPEGIRNLLLDMRYLKEMKAMDTEVSLSLSLSLSSFLPMILSLDDVTLFVTSKGILHHTYSLSLAHTHTHSGFNL